MFRAFREGSERIAIACSSIGRALDGLADVLQQRSADASNSDMPARLDAHADAGLLLAARIAELELQRPAWEARMEAELIKVGSRHSAARSAEERARKAQERIDEEEEEAGGGRTTPRTAGEDAAEGGEEGVQPLREAVEVDPRQAAIRRKFGVG